MSIAGGITMEPFRSCVLSLIAFLILLESANGNECEGRRLTKGESTLLGDYRTARSGNWSSRTTWERFDGASWVTPSVSPDSGSGIITVRNGHIVTIAASVVYGQLVVESGGQVTVASGVTHTLSDGPGVDLTIEGTWLNQGGTWGISGGAKWSVAEGGTCIHYTTAGISTPLSKAALDKHSNFIYRGGSTLVPAASFSGRSYGNLTLESTDGVWSCTASGGSSLSVCGDLTIGSGVKWITGGFSGAITIEGATTIHGEWSGSGSGNQGVHLFMGDFLVSSTGKYQLSTSGSGQGTIFFRGNVISDGTFSLPANRVVTMDGSRLQTIGGASPLSLSFWNLCVENSFGISAVRPTSVHGSLTVKAGNVRTGQNVLTLEPGASLEESGLASVLGIIEAKRLLESGKNESFGNSGLEIRPTHEFHDSVTVRRTTGSPPMIPSAKTIQRNFEISTSGQVLDADMVFHYCVTDLNGAREPNLELFQSMDGGIFWSDVGGFVNTSNHTIKLSGKCQTSRYSIAEKLRPPTVSRIWPSSGPQGTTLQVMVTGTGFDAGEDDVRFSGAGIAVCSLSVDSPIQVTLEVIVANDAALGERDLTVTTSGGSVLTSNVFEVTKRPNPCPRVTSISPPLGIRGKTMSVMLVGEGLVEDVTSVSMGERITVSSLHAEASGLRVSFAVSPNAKLGSRGLAVTNPPPGGGTSVLDSSLSVVNPVPIVTAVSPNTGICAQQLWLDIMGSDFAAENPGVTLGDGITVDSVRTVSTSEVKVQISIAPTAASGLRDLSLVNPELGEPHLLADYASGSLIPK